MSKRAAIIQTGGKQVRVSEGDIIDVELLKNVDGDKVKFEEVLLVGEEANTKVGQPFVEGCVVEGELMGEVKGPKVIAFKYKRRKSYHRKVGHRQRYSRVKITSIAG